MTTAVQSPRWHRPASAHLRTAAGIAGALVAWELAAVRLDGSFLLAGPVDVLAHIAIHAGLMWRALTVTLWAATLGFVFGNLAAIMLAAVAILVPRLERPIQALALLVFCLPLVATGPILRVLYGPGIGPQVTLAALACYYTTFVPLLVGLRAAPATWFDLVTSYGRGSWARLVHVRAFACMPYLIAGLQIAAPAAFLGAMIGEFTGAERGMGVLAIRAMRGLDVDATWALATIAAAVSIAAYAAIGWAGRRLWPDRPAMILATSPMTGGRRPRSAAVAALATAAVVLVGWQVAMDAAGLNPFFAKRPGDVWDFLVTHAAAAEHRAQLFAALGQTLGYTLPGYLAGLGLGAWLACVFVTWPGVAGTALPLAVALRSIPIVTTAPLIVLALGRGPAGTITIVAVMIFFPTLVACIQGLRQAPGQVLDVFDSYATGRWRTLLLARVPAMLPALFAAARMAVPAAILAVTVAEWLATGTGIGNLMALTASTSNYNMLWSAIVILTLVSFAAHVVVGALERAVLRVYAPEQVAR
ncbi:ABC transporter permease [Meridianimarinicoccus sp. RP-17]|uniref:ABC transporter permease n=1 Tax=Meridianimarinicoccus zhengii TaxID=2056810 RepID=UPI000DACA08A|nr:ABC transporter permease subunit [Phycocomes zhengii]